MLRQRNFSAQRLTKLYSDTKNSCDVVSGCQDVENAPELLSLHSKYRSQKDRLMTWGLDWSDGGDDKAAAQGNIDQSVARAGLTEAVTSVLGNIKTILDEAERISRGPSTTSKPFEKGWTESASNHSWALADKSRYEHLVKDLTTAIDVLYDLSRARRASQASTLVDIPLKKDGEFSAVSPGAPRPRFKSPFNPSFSSSELTLVSARNPSTTTVGTMPSVDFAAQRIQSGSLPPKLDTDSLILPHEESTHDAGGTVPPVRLVGQLKHRHSSTNPWKTDGGKDITEPVFIEYAMFDPIYRETGVPPPLERLESINGFLQEPKSNESQAAGSPSIVGYFENMDQSRIGLVYRVPEFVKPIPPGQDAHSWIESRSDRRPASLLSLLRLGQKNEHAQTNTVLRLPLEDRFRLAFNVVSILKRMHEKDIVHGNVNSASFMFFKRGQLRQDRSLTYDVRLPFLTAFDLFSDSNVDAPPARSKSPRNIYLHPDGTSKDARTDIDSRTRLDIYGLGLVLLEIGLWMPLVEVFKPKYSLGEFKLRLQKIYAKRLASQCGSLYMNCVLNCLSAGDDNPLTKAVTHEVYRRILGRLTRCCALDDAEPPANEESHASPLHHAATYEGSSFAARDSSERDRNRPALFPRHSGSHIGEKHDWNPLHRLRHPSESIRRPHTVSSISSVASTLPLAYAGIASPPITQEPTDMASERVEELQKELVKKELAMEDLRRSYDAVVRGVEADRRRHSNIDLERSTSLVDLEAHLHFRPSNIVHGAASTIQRAWRSRRSFQQPSAPTQRSSFTDYQRKVTLIQKQWRKRQTRQSQTGAEQDQTRELDASVVENGTQLSNEPPPNLLGAMMTEEAEVQELRIRSTVEESVVTQWPPTDEVREKKKLRVYPVKLSPAHLDDWHQKMGPQLMRILERALRDSPETSSVDLLGIGDNQYTARPTIFVTCSSVGKVKAAINRKFDYDRNLFDLKVRKGKVRRSHAKRRAPPVRRSMMNSNDGDSDMQTINPHYHKRPLCGASIGAFRGEHMPAVSYGGVVVVDGKPFGMSVHHLLDAQSDTESEDSDYDYDSIHDVPVRSSASYGRDSHLAHIGSAPSLLEVPDEVYPLEISDYSSEEEDLNGYYSDGSEDSEVDPLEVPPRAPSLSDSISSSTEPELDNTGDTPGVSPNEKHRIPITQPALDDVPAEFFPSRDERDDEHLLSHRLGYVYASSGVRRVPDPDIQGMRHEVDWALFELDPPRLQPYNVVQGGRRWYEAADDDEQHAKPKPTLLEPVGRLYGYEPADDLYPMEVCSGLEAAGHRVSSFGRTSRLKTGQLGEAMGMVRIWGRKTFSWAWGIVGDFGGKRHSFDPAKIHPDSFIVGGDSGAWVIEMTSGKVCGHVLAHCKEKGIAYICPMDILFDDMKRTLDAKTIVLPSADEPVLAELAENGDPMQLEVHSDIDEDEDAEAGASEADDEFEDAASWDDDEGTAVSDGNMVEAQLAKARNVFSNEDARQKRKDLRIDTPSGGLGVQLQGLGITAESPPHKEEHVLARRLRDISPPIDRGHTFMPQILGSPISGGPIR